MGTLRNLIQEADRHARRQVDDLVRILLDARLAAGLSQGAVSTAIGVTHQLVSVWEPRAILADLRAGPCLPAIESFSLNGVV